MPRSNIGDGGGIEFRGFFKFCGFFKVTIFKPLNHIIEHGREEYAEHGYAQHAAKDRGAQSTAHISRLRWKRPGEAHPNKGEGSHHNRPQSQFARL